jgi:hypothetical protein
VARVTQLFQQLDWNGGLNDSVDSGLIPTKDLVQADNVQFATNGARIKREGFSYLDKELPIVVKRASTGTTRSLVFDEAVTTGANSFFHVGEKLTIAGVGTDYNGNITVTAITTTDTTDDTITYTLAGSVSETATAATGTVTRNYKIIGLHDYWYYDSGNGIKQQELIAVSSEGEMYSYDENGNRTYIAKDSGATPNAVTPIERCDMITFNNKCIVTLEGDGNVPRFYNGMGSPAEWFDLPGAPDGSIIREHYGRLFMNDKADKDYLHFSETFDETVWLGNGDSGALYIGIEDGDPEGITSISPSFKGLLFIGKGEKIVKLVGDAPETFQVIPMTQGLGTINQRSWVPVDFDDLFFMSRRGFHSAVATDTTGDFEANFLSRKIQNTFNTWDRGKLDMTQGVYIETLNTVFWALAEDGQNGPSALFTYNPTINEGGEWTRWPNIPAYAVSKQLVGGQQVRLIVGDDAGRIRRFQNGTYADNGASYTFRFKTGTLYPDGNPITVKGFKRLMLLFRQKGRFSFQAIFRVDKQQPQAFTFEQTIEGDELGTEFTLGESILGSEAIMAPVTKQVLGYGRGCTLEIFQTGAEAQAELYGVMLEYKDVSLADEVKGSV